MLCLNTLDPNDSLLNLESLVFNFLKLQPSYNTQVNVNMITSENQVKLSFSIYFPYAAQSID